MTRIVELVRIVPFTASACGRYVAACERLSVPNSAKSVHMRPHAPIVKGTNDRTNTQANMFHFERDPRNPVAVPITGFCPHDGMNYSNLLKT